MGKMFVGKDEGIVFFGPQGQVLRTRVLRRNRQCVTLGINGSSGVEVSEGWESIGDIRLQLIHNPDWTNHNQQRETCLKYDIPRGWRAAKNFYHLPKNVPLVAGTKMLLRGEETKTAWLAVNEVGSNFEKALLSKTVGGRTTQFVLDNTYRNHNVTDWCGVHLAPRYGQVRSTFDPKWFSLEWGHADRSTLVIPQHERVGSVITSTEGDLDLELQLDRVAHGPFEVDFSLTKKGTPRREFTLTIEAGLVHMTDSFFLGVSPGRDGAARVAYNLPRSYDVCTSKFNFRHPPADQ
tara:strand:+ start:2039 stop:2917 length:879 start_codon:yes stop_codon:yes gene_type:complete